MRTDLISYVLASENRRTVVKTIFDNPDRQWSCTDLEEASMLSHASVFRTLRGLREYHLLKSFKINKKDLIYVLVKDSPFVPELKRLLNFDKIAVKIMLKELVKGIEFKEVDSILLYGSYAKDIAKYYSDVDVLIILKKYDKKIEKRIYDIAADVSYKYNKAIYPHIVSYRETRKQNDSFMKSVSKNMEVLYGKNPFRTS